MARGKGQGCCCALAILVSLAIVAVAVFLGVKFVTSSLASDSAQENLVNATSPLSTATPSTTPSGQVDCSSRNASCGECIGDVKCYFCYKDNSCRLYPASAVLPTTECPLAQVRWGATCDAGFSCWLCAAVAVIAAVGSHGAVAAKVAVGCHGAVAATAAVGLPGAVAALAVVDNRANQMNPDNWRYWNVRT
ncbi:negative regulation of DNA damage response, signal transduction by p53 class mediator [Branchiostoma belcheri]|nr:negative regulation of DNA damage response, signal transduction by p53 class mediator [Branchiostoma belcheri]